MHPDKNMGNEKAAEAFKKLQNAYEVNLFQRKFSCSFVFPIWLYCWIYDFLFLGSTRQSETKNI